MTLSRSRRRILIATLVAVVISCGVWMASGESETIQKARRLRLGMTEAEVEAIMGRESAWVSVTGQPENNEARISLFATRSEMSWCETHRLANSFLRVVGVYGESEVVRTPVEVAFDVNGRVVSIRRGSEIIEPEPEGKR
jgi:hypothetical protein